MKDEQRVPAMTIETALPTSMSLRLAIGIKLEVRNSLRAPIMTNIRGKIHSRVTHLKGIEPDRFVGPSIRRF